MTTAEEFTEIRRLRERVEAQERRIDDLTQLIHNLTKTLSVKKEPSPLIPDLRLPVFRGDHPRRWVSKVENYFLVNQTPPSMKLIVAQICMEGNTVENWFDIVLGMYPQITWPEFKEEVVARFTEEETALFQKFKRVRQEGSSVDEYLKKFEKAAVMLPELTDHRYIQNFIYGLRDVEFRFELLSRWKAEKLSVREVVRDARALEFAQNIDDEHKRRRFD